MSGFGSGGMGAMIRSLIEQSQGGTTTPSEPPGAAGNPGAGPGEPQGGYPQYGQQGAYNALSQDMSRGYLGPYNFNNNMFGYTPYGNPFPAPPPPPPAPPPYPWYPGDVPPIMGDRGGYGGRYGGYNPYMNYGQGMPSSPQYQPQRAYPSITQTMQYGKPMPMYQNDAMTRSLW